MFCTPIDDCRLSAWISGTPLSALLVSYSLNDWNMINSWMIPWYWWIYWLLNPFPPTGRKIERWKEFHLAVQQLCYFGPFSTQIIFYLVVHMIFFIFFKVLLYRPNELFKVRSSRVIALIFQRAGWKKCFFSTPGRKVRCSDPLVDRRLICKD